MLLLRPNAGPEDFDALIAAVRLRLPTPRELAVLARCLADSGEQFHAGPGAETADLSSTGGPASLSTLLVPLALVASGYRVPKLGVPGRPAGAIDALATLPGYQVQHSLDEASAVLTECGYVHSLADDRFAPLDAALFAHRRRVGAVNIPALAVASLLAKKLAFGVSRVGLDVRVFAGGNFGDTRTAAREAAALFVATARELGLVAVCMLHEGPRAWQPNLGRGEALAALHDVLIGRANRWIADHSDLCLAQAERMTGLVPPTLAAIRAVFELHLAAQGSSWRAFTERVEEINSAPRILVTAPHPGYARADLVRLREALLLARPDFAPPIFADGAGLRLTVRPGSRVNTGDVLADIRADGVDGIQLTASTEAAVKPWTERAPFLEDYFETVHSARDALTPHQGDSDTETGQPR